MRKSTRPGCLSWGSGVVSIAAMVMPFSALTLVILLLSAASVSAQDCTPQQTRLLASGDAARGIVPNPDTDTTTNIVPPGYVNIIFDASIGYETAGQTPGAPVEVSLVKYIHMGPGSYWIQGVAQAVRQTTPLLGWSGALPLFPGERLAARFVGMTGPIYVMYTGVYFPLACFPRWMNLTGGGAISMPSFAITLSGHATPKE